MDDRMEVDDFDQFDLDETDLLVLQQEEEIYLSSQQTSTQSDPSNQTQFTLPTPVTDSVPDSLKEPNSTRFSLEAERTIENLRFQLHRLELQNASIPDERHKKELSEAKELLSKKDRDIALLKMELANVKKKVPTESQKRMFPSPQMPSPRPKRAYKSNLFLKGRSSQSQPRLIEPLAHPQSSSFTTMPRLLSMALPALTQPPLSQPSLPVTTLPKCKNKLRSKSCLMKSKLTEAEKNNKLLIVLFGPVFKIWNVKNHNNSKDINICLTSSRLKYFADLFSHQFVPEKTECSSLEVYRKLSLLASDLSTYLVKSEHADGTIRLLLDVLNLCLSVCIKEDLVNVIHNIILVVNSLSSTFSVASGYLYKDLIFDKNSILKNITRVLDCFPFTQSKSNVLLSEIPDIATKPMTEIIKYSDIFEITPMELSTQLLERNTSTASFHTIQSILSLFHTIGSINDRPIFNYLLEDKSFLSLLYIDRPQDLVLGAVLVLETNCMGKVFMEDYQDKSLHVVHCLTDLMAAPQGPWTWENWYSLRLKTMLILLSLVRAQLVEDVVVEIQQLIFTKAIEVLEDIKKDFKRYQEKGPDTKREKTEYLIRMCLQILYYIIMNCPRDIFKQVKSPCVDEVLRFLPVFRKLGVYEDHPTYTLLEDIQNYMDIYLSKVN